MNQASCDNCTCDSSMLTRRIWLRLYMSRSCSRFRGVERKDFGPFKADAEVVLGRFAMIGITGLFWIPFVNGFYLYPVNF